MKVKTYVAAAVTGAALLAVTACGAATHPTAAALIAPHAASAAAPTTDSARATSAQPRAAAASARPAATASAKHYANCTALHQRWPHGVGRKHAVDHVRRPSDKPVTDFHRSKALYLANQRLDRDHDNIACEQH